MLKALVGVGHAKYDLSLYERLNVVCSPQNIAGPRPDSVHLYGQKHRDAGLIFVVISVKWTALFDMFPVHIKRPSVRMLRVDMQSTDFVVDDVLWRGHYFIVVLIQRTYMLPGCDEQRPEIRNCISSWSGECDDFWRDHHRLPHLLL